MGEVRFMISEAAKKVHVESHVLRYWEEELGLSIGRTEMGHRYYTEDDIQLFCCIKRLKDEGMLLRDLKLLIPQLNETRNRLRQADKVSEKTTAKSAVKALAGADTKTDIKTVAGADTNTDIKTAADAVAKPVTNAAAPAGTNPVSTPDSVEKSSAALPSTAVTPDEIITRTQLEQVRSLLGDVLSEVVTDNNSTLTDQISKTVTSDILREMDDLFQAKERREEEHFRKLDSLIRQQQANRRESAKGNAVIRLKKIFT